jgi:hypothetical protein
MKNINLLFPLNSNARGGAMSFGGFFFKRVLVQNYFPEPIVFNGLNNSEVTLSASMVTSGSNVSLLTTTDRDIKLKGKAIDTPTGGETWV